MSLLRGTLQSTVEALRPLVALAGPVLGDRLDAAASVASRALSESPEEEVLIGTDLLGALESLKSEADARMARFAEAVVLIDTVRDESVRDMISDVTGAARALFQERSRDTLEAFDRLHSPSTNLDDLWRGSAVRLAAWVGLRDKDDGLPLEARLLKTIYAEDEIGAALATITEKARARFEKRWKRLLRDLAIDPGKEGGPHVELPIPDYMPGVDPSALVTQVLVGSVALNTVVLAAGWHTIGWTLAHLFLPAALAAGAISVAVAHWRHEDEKAKRRKELADHLARQLAELDTQIEGRLGPQVRALSDRLRDIHVEAIERHLFGEGGRDCHRDWAARLDSRRGELARAISSERKGHEPRRVLLDAVDRLHNGDTMAAAPLAALAFELAVLEWAERFPEGRGLPSEGQLYAAIELLHAKRACDEEQRALLHKLRRQRNEIVHRLTAVLARADAKSWTERLIADAQQVCAPLKPA